MQSTFKVTAVAVLALAVSAVGAAAQQGTPGASPSPGPSTTPAPLSSLFGAAGDYTVTTFAGDELAPCGPAEPSCAEAARDDAMRFTFTVPDGWAAAPFGSDIWLAADGGAPTAAGSRPELQARAGADAGMGLEAMYAKPRLSARRESRCEVAPLYRRVHRRAATQAWPLRPLVTPPARGGVARIPRLTSAASAEFWRGISSWGIGAGTRSPLMACCRNRR